jgi:hypothetical protein
MGEEEKGEEGSPTYNIEGNHFLANHATLNTVLLLPAHFTWSFFKLLAKITF